MGVLVYDREAADGSILFGASEAERIRLDAENLSLWEEREELYQALACKALLFFLLWIS